MAETILEYVYAGDPTFAVNYALGYIDRSHVQVRINLAVDGGGDPVYANFVWVDASNITITDPLVNGDEITIIRTVPKDELAVEFSKGDDVTPLNLDKQALQGLMTYEELLDGRVGESSPKLDADRAELARDEAEAANIAAQAAQSAAEAAEANASTSETNAATSEANAANSASAASTSESNASTSETNAGNSETAAAASAAAAALSETNAGTSETNAAASAVTAGDEAADAAIFATAAASTANATLWVSGASYTLITSNVVSPLTLQTYRAKVTHSGVAIDPSEDFTNWEQLGGSGGSRTIGDAFPVSPPPSDGDLHFKTVAPIGLYIFYDDGDSTQWINTDAGNLNQPFPNFQEFHDPTSAGSYKIVGTTLECWGNLVIPSSGNTVLTFPKTFATLPSFTMTTSSNSQRILASTARLVTGITVTGWNALNNTPAQTDITWHAIGEWDGVS